MVSGFFVEGTFRGAQAMPNFDDLLPGDSLGQLQFLYDEVFALGDDGRPVTMGELGGLRGRPIRLTVEVLDG